MQNVKEAGVTLGLLSELIGFHLRLAQSAVFSHFASSLSELGLLPGAFGALEIVSHNPGLSQIQLAQAIRLDRSSLVPLLNNLEKQGWLERRQAPDDRRANELYLTPAGIKIHQRARTLVQAHEARVFAGLSEKERRILTELLARIHSPR